VCVCVRVRVCLVYLTMDLGSAHYMVRQLFVRICILLSTKIKRITHIHRLSPMVADQCNSCSLGRLFSAGNTVHSENLRAKSVQGSQPPRIILLRGPAHKQKCLPSTSGTHKYITEEMGCSRTVSSQSKLTDHPPQRFADHYYSLLFSSSTSSCLPTLI